MKKLLRLLLNRVTIVSSLMLVQFAVLAYVVMGFAHYFLVFYAFSLALSLLLTLLIINNDNNKPGYKLAWLMLVLLIPIFGSLFYLTFGGHHLRNRQLLHLYQSKQVLISPGPQDVQALGEISAASPAAGNQSFYISRHAHFSPYKNTYTEYLSSGEAKFERLKEELSKAERYIFLEYFIIEEGVMWGAILDILKEKAGQGLDIRVIYDDIGSSLKLPLGYDQYLNSLGIKCQIFNPIRPALSSKFNNRDHRKITVIDGHTVFTGGVNLADEYINVHARFGHWKDTAILLKGRSAISFTSMFLSLWQFITGDEEDWKRFEPDPADLAALPQGAGYVQPFSDIPQDGEAVCETIYLNLINKAERYLYINTPYLIIDAEILTALSVAAKNGVDVRIITPHIPDKWYVHAVTKSYYPPLLRAGVKIYEYTPGFIHAKSFIADDAFAVIGTVNLDYRSLYLHLECGVWMYETQSIRDMHRDYMYTLDACMEITLHEAERTAWPRKLGRMLLRSFAPLM